jgi:GTPase
VGLFHTLFECSFDFLNPLQFYFSGISAQRLESLITQLRFRLGEGAGRALYKLGLKDSGTAIGMTGPEAVESLSNFDLMANRLGAAVSLVHIGRGTTPNTLVLHLAVEVRK